MKWKMLAEKAAVFAKNLLFPRRCLYCGRVLGFCEGCEHCARQLKQAQISAAFSSRLLELVDCPALSGLWTCWWYKGPVRQGIWRLKFGQKPQLAKEYGTQMAELVRTVFGDRMPDCVVEVPASRRSLARRGYNVPSLLRKQLAQTLEIPWQDDILVKERETDTQHRLPRAKRKENVLKAYAAVKKLPVKSVLLVDDIVTTGATMEACARALVAAGATQVYGLAFAAAQPPFLKQQNQPKE